MRYIVFEDETVVLFGKETSFKAVAGDRAVHSAGETDLSYNNASHRLASAAHGCYAAEQEIGAHARIGDDAAIEKLVSEISIREVRTWLK